jgi:thiamine-monophosphate kinase
MGEFELIRRYFAAAACARVSGAVQLGIGDDCALLAPSAGQQLAVSTDTLVAGVHFPHDCDGVLLGQRALAVAASDLAAMGAAPLAFTLALSLPQVDAQFVQALAQGLQSMAEQCKLQLIGGDTTRGPLSLTLTVFGEVPLSQALRRSGAQPGDRLYVGGTLGDATAALPWVLAERSDQGAAVDALLQRYWQPQPQFALGLTLRGLATAALDISDGLVADVGHLAQASGVGVRIEQARVPLSPALCSLLDHPAALGCALAGGDDYRLVFTAPAVHEAQILRLHPEVCCIGQVVSGSGVQVVDEQGRPVDCPRQGYQHFGE